METNARMSPAFSLKSLLGVAAVVSLVVLVFYLVEQGYFAGGKPLCEVCQRPLHKAVSFTIVSQKGEKMTTCCPRCALRFLIENHASPVLASDFSNGGTVPAKEAFYLEGSTLMECCGSPTLRGDQGMICEMHFDRCQPSLVTFSRLEDARDYQTKYGGLVIRYENALTSVQRQMDR